VPYPCNEEYKAGDILSFYITLFGTACSFEKEVIDAAKYMCEGKLAHAQLAEYKQVYNRIWSDEGAEHIPYCNTLTVNFLTPTEIFIQGKAASQINFDLFIDRLFGRISVIIDHFGKSEFVLPYNLIANKPLIKAEYDLNMVRFNTSGQPITGVCGNVRYSGDVTRYLPYVDLGSQVHIGKKTTRACGEYAFVIHVQK